MTLHRAEVPNSKMITVSASVCDEKCSRQVLESMLATLLNGWRCQVKIRQQETDDEA